MQTTIRGTKNALLQKMNNAHAGNTQSAAIQDNRQQPVNPFKDNRPVAFIQRKLLNNVSAVKPNSFGGMPVIQRTVWRYTSGAWVQESTPVGATDTHELPDDYCLTNSITPGEHDKYDQDTGKYHSWEDALDKTKRRATSKKRPKNYGGFFDQEREHTPYARFKPRTASQSRNKSDQGPHMASHVFKRTVFDLAQSMGLSEMDVLFGSKLAPKPRQALQMMQDMLDKRGITYKPGALSSWYRDYKDVYTLATSGKKGSKKATKKLLEAHPLSVYRVGEVATEDELAGKSEKANHALDDVDSLISSDRSLGLPTGLKTIDSGYSGEGWTEGDPLRQDYIYNYGLLATGRPPSPSPYPEAPSSPPYSNDW